VLAQEAVQDQAVWQGFVTLLVLLVVFGYLGWRRGAAREFIVLVSILLAQLVRTTPLGSIVLRLLNNAWFSVQFVLHGGLTRPPSEMPKVFQEISQMPALIPAGRRESVLFMLFVITILLGYVVSGYVPRRPSPFAAILGMLNGYLIGALVLPLLPRALPASLPGNQLEPVQREAASRFMHEGLRQLEEALGISTPYLVLIFVGLLILWAALELRLRDMRRR